MDNTSGVGVLDKSARLLSVLERGPAALAELATGAGLPRPTAHRLATALERHRLVSRDGAGRFVLGPWLVALAAAAADPLAAVAAEVLAGLRDETGESSQLYRREGGRRRCVAAADRPAGLRDSVPVGALLPMTAGSAAQVLLAWAPAADVADVLAGARFDAAALRGVRRRGWAASVAEREAGVASVSAPVRDPAGRVVAAVSVSGPIDRLGGSPGRRHAPAVVRAAAELSRRANRVSPDGPVG